MRKVLKIAGAFVGVVAVLLAAAAVAVRIFLPPEKLKALAISEADKSLHRTLEVRGVEFGLFSGLDIKGLRLSERPDFSKGVFLTADSFTLRPEWLPLLRKEIVARRVELRGASVEIVKEPDGRFNFSDLSSPGAAPPAAKSPAAPAPAAARAASASAPSAALALAVNSLSLRDVAIHYADERERASADADIESLDVEGFRPSGPFSISLDARADYAARGSRRAVSFKAEGKADLGGGDPARESAQLSRFSLAVKGKAVTGSLSFENADAPKISIQADVPAMDASFLNSALGEAAVPAGTELPALTAQASLAYVAPVLDVSSFKIAAKGAELSGSASAVGGVLTLRGLELRSADLDAKASGTVSGLGSKRRELDLKLDAGEFSLASLVPLAALGGAGETAKRLGLGGKAALSAVVRGSAASPKASGTLVLDGAAAKLEGHSLDRTTGRIAFTQDSVDAPNLAGRLDGGDFTLKASASRAPAVAGAPVKTSGDLAVDKIAQPNFQSGKASLTWSLTGITPDMRRLAGTARLLVSSGKAVGILDLARSRGGLARALVVPLEALQKARDLHVPGLDIPDMQDLPFNKIEGDYSAQGGVVTMRPFSIDSPVIGLDTTGTVDLGAQTANLKTTVKTSLGGLDLAIAGPFSKLSVRPIVSQQLRNTLENQGRALLNRFLQR